MFGGRLSDKNRPGEGGKIIVFDDVLPTAVRQENAPGLDASGAAGVRFNLESRFS